MKSITMKTPTLLFALVSGLAALTASAELLVYRTTSVNHITGNGKFRTVVRQGYTVIDETNSRVTLVLSGMAGGKTFTTNEFTNIVTAASKGPGHNAVTTLAAANSGTNGDLSFWWVSGKTFPLTLSTNTTVLAPKNANGIARRIAFTDPSQTNAVIVESSLILHFDPRITATNNNAGVTYSDIISNLVANLSLKGHHHDDDGDDD